uniref:Uncharacterized protein n=1 Tax=Florenciella sp. virus SA2 TaxID=3240092 RepID=A0AB39J921_9VIRU
MNNDHEVKLQNNASVPKEKVCKEYNSLKYKTMIMTGNTLDAPINNETNQNELDKFLETETQNNKGENWSKLSKTERIKKLNVYVDNILTNQHQLNKDESSSLKQFLYHLLDRKKITKNNEITYNEESGIIENIHILLFNSKSRKFTLNKNLNDIKKSKRKTTKKSTK